MINPDLLIYLFDFPDWLEDGRFLPPFEWAKAWFGDDTKCALCDHLEKTPWIADAGFTDGDDGIRNYLPRNKLIVTSYIGVDRGDITHLINTFKPALYGIISGEDDDNRNIYYEITQVEVTDGGSKARYGNGELWQDLRITDGVAYLGYLIGDLT